MSIERIRSKANILAHSLKGSGSSFGYPLITKLAAEADDLLMENDNLAEQDIQFLGNRVEALSIIAEKRISGNGGKAGRILLQGLSDSV